jgi:Tol biopolymer transport system component
VDKRTDIWAFGCVLYECLAGRQLFEGETVSDLIAKILQTEPDWGGLPAATPSSIRALLKRCLQKDARERLRDIGEARIALASPADEASTSVPAARPAGLPWWAAVAAALALTAITVLATEARPRVRPAAQLDLAVNAVDVDWRHAPVLSPDGAAIAYLSKDRIWIRDLTELAPRAIADVTSSTPVGWSPDSRAVVFADTKKLWRVPVEGGKPTAICEIPGTGHCASWSRSGVIALAVWRGGLYKVAAGGGPAELFVDIDPATTVDFHAPSWLANGDLLYITHWNSLKDGSGRSRAFLTVFDGKQQIPVTGDLGNDEAAAIVAPTGELLFLRAGANPGLWSVPYDLTRRRVDGTPVVISPEAVSMSVSEDGSLLYIEGSVGEERRELVWVDRSGKVIEVVGPGHAGLSGVALSPDGRRVAFSAQDGGSQDIWVRDLARGTETRLTFSGDSVGQPEWLASSSRLAYINVKGLNLQGRIFAVNADGSGGQREFAPAAGMGASANSFNVAPDGRSAVRIVDERGIGRLRVGPIGPDGSLGGLRPLLSLEPEPDIQDANISPDGKLLAYVTNDPRRAVDLFLTRFPEGVGQWQVGTEGGRTPRWAKDSGELFYVAGSGPSRRAMVSVRVDPAQDPPLGEATRLFEFGGGGELDLSDGNRFDVTPDGKRFLFVRPAGRAGGTPQRMVLVLNWREELKKDGAR